jgi:type IV secretion system protein VirD4
MSTTLLPLVSFAVSVAGLGLYLALHFLAERRRPDTHGDSRWAKKRDLRFLMHRRPAPHGVVIGWLGDALLQTPEEDNVLAFGVQRSGKTSTLVVPTLLEWRGAAVATSTKDELVRLTGRHRRGMAPAYVFAPLDDNWTWIHQLGLQLVTWNVVDQAVSAGVAAELADIFTAHGKDSPSAHWYLSASNLLTALLLVERQDGGNLSSLLRRINTTPRDGWGVLADQHPGLVGEILAGFAATPDREAGSILSTARAALSLWLDDRIVRATTSAPEHQSLDLDNLLTRGATLYLVAPAEEAERGRPLFTALLGTLLRRATSRARMLGGRLEPRLLLALDEVANFARIPRLASYVSTGPGQGIQTLLCCHDLAQLESIYGHDEARTVWNNCRARLLLPGQGDLKTLDQFSRSMGNETALYQSKAWSSHGTRSTSEGRVAKPLASPDALRRQKGAVLVYANSPPIRLTPRRWDQVPAWRTTVESARASPNRI